MPIRDEPDIMAALREQDARLRFTAFDHDDAIAVGTRIIELARQRDQTISTSVWLGQQLVFQASLAGTTADNDGWMNRKVATVRRYDVSSLQMLQRAQAAAAPPGAAWGIDPIDFAFNGGAVPIRVGSLQVGVAVASGVNDYVEHDLVVEVLSELLH
jgi:uncharacterized protein (UPF0303 family)